MALGGRQQLFLIPLGLKGAGEKAGVQLLEAQAIAGERPFCQGHGTLLHFGKMQQKLSFGCAAAKSFAFRCTTEICPAGGDRSVIFGSSPFSCLFEQHLKGGRQKTEGSTSHHDVTQIAGASFWVKMQIRHTRRRGRPARGVRTPPVRSSFRGG